MTVSGEAGEGVGEGCGKGGASAARLEQRAPSSFSLEYFDERAANEAPAPAMKAATEPARTREFNRG